MLPHHYLGQYFYSLYVDGNIRIVRNPRDLVDKYLTRYCIAIPPHPDRSCVYDEVRACIEMGVLRASDVEAQIEEYAENGFPVNAGLWENNVILRKHNEPSVVRLMEDWWREYKEKSKRDQISLPYLRWKHGIEIGEIAEGPRVSSKYFSIGLHASDLDAGWIRKVSRYALANRHRRLMYRAMAQFVSLGISFRKRMLQRVRFKKRGICQ